MQTLSLVWGGQDPDCGSRKPSRPCRRWPKRGTCRLQAARELAADYQTLRKVDAPSANGRRPPDPYAAPAPRQACAPSSCFWANRISCEPSRNCLARVQAHFAAFFDAGAAGEDSIDPGPAGKAPEHFATRLKALGFTDVQHVAERLRAWANGDVPALRSERARELLESLRPSLLAALARQAEAGPRLHPLRYADLPAARRHPITLAVPTQPGFAGTARRRCWAPAPALAEHLAQDAQALEALLVPAARFAAPKPILGRNAKEAADLEDAFAITRHFVRREEFISRLQRWKRGSMPMRPASCAATWPPPRSPACCRASSPSTKPAMAGVKGMKFGVVALGKAGSGEMLAGSDLDLMLIYDHARLDSAPTQYFVRLAHTLTGALTAQGPEGPIYKVDMRLRPSGNQGPVAVSLAAFRQYHAAESWTWERLALTRACVLAATPGFQPILADEILIALTREQEAATIRAETLSMLSKLNTEIAPAGPWDVKYRKGGMIELAFIAEALQLIHGPKQPDLFRGQYRRSPAGVAKFGHLSESDSALLQTADFLWRTIQGIDRITGPARPGHQPAPGHAGPAAARHRHRQPGRSARHHGESRRRCA